MGSEAFSTFLACAFNLTDMEMLITGFYFTCCVCMGVYAIACRWQGKGQLCGISELLSPFFESWRSHSGQACMARSLSLLSHLTGLIATFIKFL